MKTIIGLAACALAMPLAGSEAAAPANHTVTGKFAMTVTYTENDERHYMHNQDSDDSDENMMFTLSVTHPYLLTVDRSGKLVGISEMSANEIKKRALSWSGGGTLQYHGQDKLISLGSTMTAEKTYGGHFRDTEVNGYVTGTGNGFAIHADVAAANIGGSCSYHSKNVNTEDCNGVPLTSIAPDIIATAPSNAKFRWSSDFLEHPTAGIKVPDAYTNFIMSQIVEPVGVNQTGGGGVAFNFRQTWEFSTDDAANGQRKGKRTLAVQARLSPS